MLSRRNFLASGMAMAVASTLPRGAWGHPDNTGFKLEASTHVIDVDGHEAKVFGIQGPSGQGLVLNPGERFKGTLVNRLAEPTSVHWHGQTPPNAQDGVPYIPLPPLKAGESRQYDFEPHPGTYWMHSHIPSQEVNNLAAPLIVHDKEDLRADRQEVVMFLQDFSFRTPQEILDEVVNKHGHDKHSMHGNGHSMGVSMDMSRKPDLNDYNWDAYLTNYRTLSDPDVVRIEKNGKILLRVINASSATVFWIDTGNISARLVAVDGHPVRPVVGNRFGIAEAQRLDLELELPKGSGTWPVLALREGGRERTGMVLATRGAAIPKISAIGLNMAPPFDFDYAQESALVALSPLESREPSIRHQIMLGGSMQPYRWTINGRTWDDRQPITAITGDRVELRFENHSHMAHPMHLHGHVFQVVELNGKRINGARRDTIQVPPMATAVIALDAGQAAHWMLHCHQMLHLQTGMMTEFDITG